MAAVAIDSLEYAHQLEAVGMPRDQAEVIARGLTIMLVHNFDALVTKDYLDTRFSEMDVSTAMRLAEAQANTDKRFSDLEVSIATGLAEAQANTDKRFSDLEVRFAEAQTNTDKRFVALEAKFDKRCTQIETKIDLLCAHVDGKIDKLYMMFGVIMVGLSVPIIQTLFTWLA